MKPATELSLKAMAQLNGKVSLMSGESKKLASSNGKKKKVPAVRGDAGFESEFEKWAKSFGQEKGEDGEAKKKNIKNHQIHNMVGGLKGRDTHLKINIKTKNSGIHVNGKVRKSQQRQSTIMSASQNSAAVSKLNDKQQPQQQQPSDLDKMAIERQQQSQQNIYFLQKMNTEHNAAQDLKQRQLQTQQQQADLWTKLRYLQFQEQQLKSRNQEEQQKLKYMELLPKLPVYSPAALGPSPSQFSGSIPQDLTIKPTESSATNCSKLASWPSISQYSSTFLNHNSSSKPLAIAQEGVVQAPGVYGSLTSSNLPFWGDTEKPVLKVLNPSSAPIPKGEDRKRDNETSETTIPKNTITAQEDDLNLMYSPSPPEMSFSPGPLKIDFEDSCSSSPEEEKQLEDDSSKSELLSLLLNERKPKPIPVIIPILGDSNSLHETKKKENSLSPTSRHSKIPISPTHARSNSSSKNKEFNPDKKSIPIHKKLPEENQESKEKNDQGHGRKLLDEKNKEEMHVGS